LSVQQEAGLGSEALLESAAAIVERASARPGVHEAEAHVGLTVNSFCRFADVGPTQSAERARLEVSLRIRLADGSVLREAGSQGQSLDLDAVDALIERASNLAAVSPALENPVAQGGPVKADMKKLSGFADAATLSHDASQKAKTIDRAIARCEELGLKPAGLYDTTGAARALFNSSGRALKSETSRASFALTATVPDATGMGGAGWGECIRSSAGELEAGLIDAAVARALQKAAPGVERGAVEPGEYTVVLEPAAVSSLLLFASYYGFGAKEVEEQSSFLCGRVGEKLFPDELVIRDRWNHPLYTTMAFDGEGTPRKSLALLEKGAFTGPVTDRRFAAKLAGDPDLSTGHGECQPSGSGPSASCLSIDAGDQTLTELIGGVKRGLLVTQFHYTNVIDPREMMLTGMTRNGLFLIENGELAGPLKNLRFTQSLLSALQNVTGIGSELDISGALFDGEVIAPPLRIDGFRFTSATDF
jgi:predicted Zn-dependent protease